MVCLPVDRMEDDVEEIFDNSDYVVKRKGGRSLIDKPPIFSPDESCIFVISGRGVQVYDVNTTEFVRSLKDKTNSSPIVGMGFPFNDDRTLVTCSEDGSVIFWKWHAVVQSSKITLKLPENARVLSFDLLSSEKAVVGWVTKKVSVAVMSLTGDGQIKKPTLQRLSSPMGPCWCVAVGWNGERNIVAVSEGTSFVSVFDAENPSNCICHAVSREISATYLAWHPTQDILAVGDTLGRVTLWRAPLSTNKPPRETMHWHHLPLAAVTFSIQGGILLSGGAERVLVAWGHGNSKRFVPRMPAEILHIASSTSHIVVSTADNGIQIINAGSLNIIGCIREAGGLGGARRVVESVGQSDESKLLRKGPALQYSHPTNALVLPAGPGHLHMYSTTTDSLMYTLDVTNTNIVPPERNNLQPEQIEVTEMSVGCRGQWLCTWEGRGEQERLRWFSLSSRSTERGWSLHTVMARPHRPASPAALHMATDAMVTVSYDDKNQLRFWSLVDSLPGYEGKSAWCTVAQGASSGGPAGGAALSGDGSVCALWSGSRLTLWDAQRGRQRACLTHPALRGHGRLVQFGREHHMHYITCTTDTALAVWNTLSLRLVWIVQLNTTCLVADPFSDRVAAVTDTNDVFVFRMSSSSPLATLKEALPPQGGAITSAAFAPCHQHFRLYLLREQQEIFVVEHTDVENQDMQGLEKLPLNSRPAPSAYSAMIAEKTLSLVKAKSEDVAAGIINTRPAITELLLSSASHAQPSLRTLCGPLLRIIAGSKVVTYESEDTKEDPMEEKSRDVNIIEKKLRKYHKVSVENVAKESVGWAESLFNLEEVNT